MKRKKGKKLFSLLLIAAMVLSLSGIMAFATESNKQAGDEISEETAEQDLSFKSSKVSKTTDDAPFTNKLSGAEGKVSYTSSNKSVASVDQNGKVTIVGAGTATIKATDEENGTASFTLTVTKPAEKETTPASDVTNGDDENGEADEAAEGGGDGEAEEDIDEAAETGEDGEAEEDIDEAAETGEDGEAEEDIDEAAETGEDGEAEEDIDEDAETGEDGEAEEDIDEAAETGEDGEAEEDIDEAAGTGEDGEAEEDIDEAAGTGEDGEEAGDADETAEADEVDEDDSFIMEEPLLAEMTGMTVTFYSTAATGREEQDLSFDAGNTVYKDVNAKPFINPLNGAVGEVDYSSSDESVATVDGYGIVTINGTGTSIITAEAAGDSEYETTRISYLTVVSDDSESESESGSETESYSESEADAQPKGDTMDIMVTIFWEGDTDSMRPDSVEIALLADGVEIDTAKLVDDNGTWKYTWSDLPVYSEGNTKISYTVKEKDTPSGYTASYSDWFNEDANVFSIIVTDTWGVESTPSGTNGPKTSDINFWVLYMYLAVLSGAAIITLSVCRRASRR